METPALFVVVKNIENSAAIENHTLSLKLQMAQTFPINFDFTFTFMLHARAFSPPLKFESFKTWQYVDKHLHQLFTSNFSVRNIYLTE